MSLDTKVTHAFANIIGRRSKFGMIKDGLKGLIKPHLIRVSGLGSLLYFALGENALKSIDGETRKGERPFRGGHRGQSAVPYESFPERRP